MKFVKKKNGWLFLQLWENCYKFELTRVILVNVITNSFEQENSEGIFGVDSQRMSRLQTSKDGYPEKWWVSSWGLSIKV